MASPSDSFLEERLSLAYKSVSEDSIAAMTDADLERAIVCASHFKCIAASNKAALGTALAVRKKAAREAAQRESKRAKTMFAGKRKIKLTIDKKTGYPI